MSYNARPQTALLLLLALSSLVLAACVEVQQMSNFRSGDRVVIPASEVVEGDLYVAGGSIIIDGRVKGDLVAVGGDVAVNGPIEGDLFVAGGQVVVNGAVGEDVAAAGWQVKLTAPIAGDVRAAGGSLSFAGSVAEDVLVAGGSVVVGSSATIGGDLLFASDSMTIEGSVKGDVRGVAEAYDRSGSVGGEEEVRIEEKEEKEDLPTATERLVGRVRTLAGLLLVGGVLVWLRPQGLDALVSKIQNRPWASLGWGLLTWVGIFFGLVLLTVIWVLAAAILGVATLGGLAATLVISGLLADVAILLALIISAVFLSSVIVGLALGQVSLSRLAPTMPTNRFTAMALGMAVLVLVASLPFIGVVTDIVVGFLGVGVIGWALYDLVPLRRRSD